ncbi:glycosyl transferase family 2 [Desulfarculus baarsii DSM 2075]|uniref:Glycosyl transferase family 2 n=1 Tax=Desulfarculus baarsii (strain ATCC 33931 / DSM 2075 / LMG 7858 / VKM B-1802 / 2st14) TaxID=644282 RepID=E1QFM9_DESB2|nr:glycosyltransferase family 2 protein [Desulfarculus baarsii]ADK84365.1 glycosyl transferase family 2 [Desulfarculus baarsii DSM 2075]
MVGTFRKALITVIIVNYNAKTHLARCLDALREQTVQDFHIVLVDNASTDGSLNEIYTNENLTVVRLAENVGFAAANNIGALRSQSEFIALLNPDAFPAPTWLEKLMEHAKAYPEYAAFGSTQLLDANSDLLDGAGDVLYFFGLPRRSKHLERAIPLPPTREVFSPCAAAALYRRHLFVGVGGLDEAFFCYCEDVDLGFRLRLRGYKCLQVADAIVRHVGGGSSGQISGFAERHGHRNALWMHIKNMPMPLLALTLPCHFIAEFAKAIFDIASPSRGRLAQRAHNVKCRIQGICEALAQIGPMMLQRRIIQEKRVISSCSVARTLCWRPWAS